MAGVERTIIRDLHLFDQRETKAFVSRVSLQDQNSVPNSDSDMFYGLNDRN